jgi:hypothetical protein
MRHNNFWLGLLGSFIFVVGAAMSDQQPNNGKPSRSAPKTPLGCRQQVLEEIGRFRKLEGPTRSGGDEHIGRSMARHFHECRITARLALAYTGDKQAINELIRDFDLENGDNNKWLEDRSKIQLGMLTAWPEQTMSLVRALETHRPDLATRTRQRLWRRWEKKDVPRNGAPDHSPGQLSLEEIAKAAKSATDFDAMIAYARLDRTRAVPLLLKLMSDTDKAISVRHAAARAAARSGDMQALVWLEQAAMNNVGLGGWPGQSLLEAGDEGARRFFRLVDDWQRKHPKDPLPYALSEAVTAGLDVNLLYRHLPRLLEIKDARLQFNIGSALSSRPLPVTELVFLIGKLRQAQYKEDDISRGIERSLWAYGPASIQARQTVELWVDELHRAGKVETWELGARIFLRTRLGTPEFAAAAARRHLATNPELACGVLAETGKATDAVLLWQALHQGKLQPYEDWYTKPALGWVATMRLTQGLPEAKQANP